MVTLFLLISSLANILIAYGISGLTGSSSVFMPIFSVLMVMSIISSIFIAKRFKKQFPDGIVYFN